MVQPYPIGPRRPALEDRLVPDLRRRPRISGDERTAAFTDGGDDLGKQRESDLPGPEESVDGRRDEGINLESFRNFALDEAPASGMTIGVYAEKRVARGLEVAERRGQSPGSKPGADAAKPGETELGLYASLAGHELVPLVDDDGSEIREKTRRVLPREQQRETFGCRDERGRQPLALARADRGRRITGAGLERPGEAQLFDRSTKCLFGVRRQSSERGDPEHSKRRRRARSPRFPGVLLEPLENRTQPRGVGLPRSRRRMDESTLPGAIRTPHLMLILERPPRPACEPARDRLVRGLPRLDRKHGNRWWCLAAVLGRPVSSSSLPKLPGEIGASRPAWGVRRILERGRTPGSEERVLSRLALLGCGLRPALPLVAAHSSARTVSMV